MTTSKGLKAILLALKTMVYNKRINARKGQKHVGSLRFAWYCSLRVFARYAGVRLKNGIHRATR